MRLRKIYIVVFWTLTFTISANGQEKNKQQDEILKYISNNDVFTLIDIYPSIKDSLNVAFQSFTEAFIYKCIGNSQASMHYIDETLKEQDKIDDDIKINTLSMLVDNLMQIQEYNEAANVMKYILEITAPFIDETSLKEFETWYNEILKYQNLPKRRFIRSEESSQVDFKLKEVGRGELMFIPCEINGKESEAIFDTGCSMSNVSLSFALENNIYMTDNTVPLHGIGGSSEGCIGIIDSIQVGNMIYRDVVCAIRISPGPIDNVADISLGVDLMKDAGEFHILPKEEKLFFPVHDTPFPDTGINMAIINNVPCVKAYTENERAILLFDSGNVGMDMYEPYYRKHMKKIQGNGLKEEIPVSGIGGLSKQEVYILSKLPLQIGETIIDVNNVCVFTDNIIHEMNDIDAEGNLGIKFIKACNKITINFRRSFVKAE